MTNKKRLLNLFLDLIKIYSPSKSEQEVGNTIIEKLSLLGLTTERDSAGNILAKIPPKGIKNTDTCLLSAHMDVVEPCKNIETILEKVEGETIIKSAGNTVLGADDKAGIAMIIEAITCLIEQDADHGPIEIVFTTSEEIGLLGAKAFNIKKLQAKYGFVMDHSDPVGVAICKSPEHVILKLNFIGKSTHAGLNPEDGINAIQVASKAITNMPIGKLDAESTANVGIISGGKAANIVPDSCKLTCEVRSHNKEKLKQHIGTFINAAYKAIESYPGSNVEIEEILEYHGVSIPENSTILKIAQQAANHINLDFKTVTTCGGSDASIFTNNGIQTICLGSGFKNPHSENESISVENLILGTEYLISIIKTVSQKDYLDE